MSLDNGYRRETALPFNTLRDALRRKGNVMKAVMLRDMRTRFFNHGLGFVLVPLWPLTHLFILLTIYHVLGRAAPYGDSLDIFFGSGLIPTLSFMYVSRFTALSLVINRPMLSFPAVQITDILFGRACLEMISACIMSALAFFALVALGVDPMPLDPLQALIGYVMILICAGAVGIIIGMLAQLNKMFMTFYFLITIIVYITSGTLFVIADAPAVIQNVLRWSPVVQGVEWMRVAVLPGYPTQVLNKPYLVVFTLVALFVGLGMERLLRGRLLQK